ncbi:MAG: 5'/3'-nucleotidase SurE [Candidatus Cloacimonadia bacterium]
MKILLTNDDGIEAPGLNILADALIKEGYELIIVAPEIEKSASSQSITTHNPLRVVERSKNRYAVSGSPSDSVIIACEVILKEKVDLVVSGINGGPNIGEDVLYSGTVAAAIEGMHFGYPAIAVSLNSREDEYFQSAAQVVVDLLAKGAYNITKEKAILNVNVPALPFEEIKGYRLTKTGRRSYVDLVIESTDPRGRTIYWLGGDKPKWVPEEGTDIEALKDGFVAISPLTPNYNNFSLFPQFQQWIDDNKS